MKLKGFVTISEYHDVDKFNQEVNKWIAMGYHLYGPVSITKNDGAILYTVSLIDVDLPELPKLGQRYENI